jgi:hypothetical protein
MAKGQRRLPRHLQPLDDPKFQPYEGPLHSLPLKEQERVATAMREFLESDSATMWGTADPFAPSEAAAFLAWRTRQRVSWKTVRLLRFDHSAGKLLAVPLPRDHPLAQIIATETPPDRSRSQRKGRRAWSERGRYRGVGSAGYRSRTSSTSSVTTSQNATPRRRCAAHGHRTQRPGDDVPSAILGVKRGCDGSSTT